MGADLIEKLLATKIHLALILAFILSQKYLCPSILFIKAMEEQVHIVYMGAKKYDNPAITKESHHQLLSGFLGSKVAARSSILYSYKHGFSGFAASLTKTQAAEIADLPGVVQVIPNRIHKLHTTRSWDFVGLEPNRVKNLMKESNTGNEIIIGIIDSGIWPESASFRDEGLGPVPSRWKGICQPGERFNSSSCNKKLVGARWFVKGIKNYLKIANTTFDKPEFLSARDAIGHGSHTASTAAGNFVQNVSYEGLARGLARGGSPLAHLAIYKVCWAIDGGMCTDADILKAFDKAIYDGVDILSLSLGISIPILSYVDHRDSVAIGSFHAMENGITTIASAGNDGPFSQTVVNVAPWLITVAASTIDRTFAAAVTLGNNSTLWGQSINTGTRHRDFYGLTYARRIAVDSGDGLAQDCQEGSLNATLAAGKIILCFMKSESEDRSYPDIVLASQTVEEAGGVGVIFAQSRSDGLPSCTLIPCAIVDYEVGTQILSYIRRARSPIAKLSYPSSILGKQASPRLASFSSRGPSSLTPQVLKPDVAAPGVDILAAYPPIHDGKSSAYSLLSGTSMACPHVAGIAALIKSLHPMWSPAAIRSALVTTASQTRTDGMDIYDGGPRNKAADPFDIGGGHVNPNRALDPGLIYDLNVDDYVLFLCSTGFSSRSVTRLTNTPIQCKKDIHHEHNLNLPSIIIPNFRDNVTVSRTVKNVGPAVSVYKAIVQPPYGIDIKVNPRVLSFNSSVQVVSFEVTFLSSHEVEGDYRFGSLTWTDGQHFVRSPIAVRVMEFGTLADL